MLIKLTPAIDLNEAHAYLQSPGAGGTALFIGTVRNKSGGKHVVKLSFEAYESLALKEMQRIALEAEHRWPVLKLLIIHATGDKLIGEPVVVTGVAAAHRDAAFEACRFLIDELKKKVPVWKHEFYNDHSVWVNAHP